MTRARCCSGLAKRTADADLLALDRKGLCQTQEDRIGDRRQLFGLAQLRYDDLKLVAAQPPDLPLVTDDLGQPSCDLL